MNYRFIFDNPEVVQHFHAAMDTDQRTAKLRPLMRMYYRFIRPAMPLRWRQSLQSAYRQRVNERWYLPETFLVDLRARLKVAGPQQLIHPWPERANFGFVLTHDVETYEGLQHALEIADLEQRLGFRSSWNIVPHKYDVDEGIVRELQDRGFEVGVHGYNHDGRLFASKGTFDRRATAIEIARQQWNANGFRAPMMHRNIEWLQQLDFDYDGSFFDADPFQPMPGGVGMVWPFMAEELVVLPTTLPQDHTLFVVLSEQDDRIWREKLAYLKRYSGMALMLTHPDYLVSHKLMEIYRGFLEHVREEGGCWHGLPRELAVWWRDRDASRIEGEEIVGPASTAGSPCQVTVRDHSLDFSAAVHS